jgi:hypothetical protein
VLELEEFGDERGIGDARSHAAVVVGRRHRRSVSAATLTMCGHQPSDHWTIG